MKFTLSWLRDHLDTDADLDAITARLTGIGLEVEGVDNPSAKLAPFVIARILDAKQHPQADRLRVCQVDTGKGAVEVVCGAPNARPGLLGVFAPLGAYIPGTGITLEKRPVRGIVSNGMMVSERELELSDAGEGIIELDDTLAGRIGERYVDVMGLDDPVIEIKLTPNRPDCLGVRGIARDLAAAGLGRLSAGAAGFAGKGEHDCPVPIALEFADAAASACPAFAGRHVRGVKNTSSPDWLQRRLKAVGQRPISALVDVTNYVTLDRGRPLHVYDADRITGTIRARLGRTGESFLALDGKTYAVDEEMCVIADDQGVLGLGGIIGGDASGSTEATTNVLIESAYFDPVRTARTGRKLGLQTDARYRFERGVDPGFVMGGLDLATAMILELCGGTPSKARMAGTPPEPRTVVSFSFASVARLTGLELAEADMRQTLTGLGFTVPAGKKADAAAPVAIAVPSWRPDVTIGVDIVEEIVRIAGIDSIRPVAMSRDAGVARPVLTPSQRRSRRARRVLASRGMVEAVTWSFVSRAHAELFGGGSDELELANPISTELSSMRPSLLAGLVAAAARNRHRGFADTALFEIGQAYRGDKPEDQFLVSSGVRTGSAKLAGAGRHWGGTMGGVDVFDVKADAAGLLSALGLDPAKAQVTRDAPGWFHPGRSGTLRLGPKVVLAHFGELHPSVLEALDLGAPAAAFEVFLDALPPEKRKSKARSPLDAADLLPVRRDFAFVLDADVAAGDVLRAAAQADKRLIAGVEVFDLFEGTSLGEGKKSLAIEVTLQPRDATLTDEEIEAVGRKIVAEVRKATGGEIRG
ncbi:MAG: phenylalanine--tRNA ligase subunit beta [Hyphomicrobiaceae bacterium]|nr:phenylalanine--tRNA ligase subunit beta [Hyphomicrobiaceae bacterium]